MNNLKPCPFCGAIPTTVSQLPEDRNYGRPDESAECLTKDCAMYQHLIPVDDWNRRPQPVSGFRFGPQSVSGSVPSVEDIVRIMDNVSARWIARDVSEEEFACGLDGLKAHSIRALLQQSAVQPVSREAIGKAFRDNHRAGNRDDLGLDAVYALQLTPPADGGWVAVERLIRAARFGVEAAKGRILASGDSSQYSKANLEQLILTMEQLDDAINALPPPPAKGKE